MSASTGDSKASGASGRDSLSAVLLTLSNRLAAILARAQLIRRHPGLLGDVVEPLQDIERAALDATRSLRTLQKLFPLRGEGALLGRGARAQLRIARQVLVAASHGDATTPGNARDAAEVIANSTLVVDLRTQTVWYRGYQLDLPPGAFRFLSVLAQRPGGLVTKGDLYDRLWPESRGRPGADRPYERQIADHKRKLVRALRALGVRNPRLSRQELERLIQNKPRRGYVLALSEDEVALLEGDPKSGVDAPVGEQRR